MKLLRRLRLRWPVYLKRYNYTIVRERGPEFLKIDLDAFGSASNATYSSVHFDRESE